MLSPTLMHNKWKTLFKFCNNIDILYTDKCKVNNNVIDHYNYNF